MSTENEVNNCFVIFAFSTVKAGSLLLLLKLDCIVEVQFLTTIFQTLNEVFYSLKYILFIMQNDYNETYFHLSIQTMKNNNNKKLQHSC